MPMHMTARAKSGNGVGGETIRRAASTWAAPPAAFSPVDSTDA